MADYVPTRKLTWNLKMMGFNRNLLFQGSFSGSMLVFGGVCVLFFHQAFHSQRWMLIQGEFRWAVPVVLHKAVPEVSKAILWFSLHPSLEFNMISIPNPHI